MTGRPGQGRGSGPAAPVPAESGSPAPDASRGRSWAAADLVTPALDAIVEGAWLALVYAAVQLGLVHGDATLGALPFAIAAGLGVAWSRPGAGRRAGGAGALAALAIGVGAVGWLSDPAARVALGAAAQGRWGTDAMGTAVATNIGGWLLGVAVLRGATHASRSRDEERIGAMLERIPLLAIPWVIGLAFSLDRRPEFIASALLSTLLFVGGGLIAVGLGRLESLGPAGGVDWRRNRAWLAVVGGVVALLLAVAVPAAFLVGAPPAAIGDAILLPLLAIVGALAAVATVVGAPLLAAFESFMASLPEPVPSPTPAASPPLVPGGGVVAPVEGDPRVGLTIAIVVFVVIALVFAYVVLRIRAVDRRPPAAPRATTAPEDRSFVVPTIRAHIPRVPRGVPFRGTPRTAQEAYLALLDDLEGDPLLARRASEPPRVHARRVTASGLLRGEPAPATAAGSPGSSARSAVRDVDLGMLAADRGLGSLGGRAMLAERDAEARRARAARRALLARVPRRQPPPGAPSATLDRDLGFLVADWELARYGARALTPSEDRRGVGRWRRLRAAVRSAGARRHMGAR